MSNNEENKEKLKKDEIKYEKEKIKQRKKKEKEKREEEKEKKQEQQITKNKNKKLDPKDEKCKKVLKLTIYIALIVLISLISFLGIYVQDKNKISNKLPQYSLATDINGVRNIVIKVNTGTETKKYDANGTEITNNTTNNETQEGVTTKEVAVNDESLLNIDNYQKSMDIILKRLKYMNVSYYEVKFDQNNGTIYLEVPEDSNTDYIAQYCITKGEFKVSDNDTSEVLLSNSDVKEAKVAYNTTTSGTTVYLNIKFNKAGAEKLKDVSNTYVKSTDSDGKETTKKIKMTLDDQTIMSTYFEQEITDGTMQLSIGTSTDSSKIQNYVKQASNVAVFLNSEAMPITYQMDINRFVYSDITNKVLLTLIAVLSVVVIILLVFMLLKYKKNALLPIITLIGYLAVLLLIIRFASVGISLLGVFAILLSVIIEYLILMEVLKTYNNKDYDKETRIEQMQKTKIKQIEKIIPILIVAVVFSLIKWEVISSMGMILFWAIIEGIIYNFITLKIIFNTKNQI